MTARFEITAGLKLATGITRRHGSSDPTFWASSIVPGALRLDTPALAIIIVAILPLPQLGALVLRWRLGHERG